MIFKTIFYKIMILIISRIDFARLIAGALGRLIEYAANRESLREWLLLMSKRIRESSDLVIKVIEDGKVDQTECELLADTLNGWGAAERVKYVERALSYKIEQRLQNAKDT